MPCSIAVCNKRRTGLRGPPTRRRATPRVWPPAGKFSAKSPIWGCEVVAQRDTLIWPCRLEGTVVEAESRIVHSLKELRTMCLLAVQYKSVPEAPILVAANREEAYDRAALVPSIQPGKPRVLSGVDTKAGGTWLGVNQSGLFVGAANRPRLFTPSSPKSRGLLCRDLLRANSARHAVDIAMEELTANKYDGVNFVIADYESGWAVHGGDDPNVTELIEGLNIISSFDVNDMRDERSEEHTSELQSQ